MLITAISIAFIIVFAFLIINVRNWRILKSEHDMLMVDYKPVDTLKNELSSLSKNYSELQSEYKSHQNKITSLNEIISFYNLGVGTVDSNTYKPTSNTRDIYTLEKQLEQIEEKIRDLVGTQKACISNLPLDMVVDGKKSVAKTFVNREIKLRIRCLDNETKWAIATAEWNNINRLISRIENKFHEINSESKLVRIFLTNEYLHLKILELRLNFEIKQLKNDLKEEEKEERQRIREEERDKIRMKTDLEKIERDKIRMEKLVKQELEKINSATDIQKRKLELHIKELELLKQKQERAKSLAQQTKAGYVYIISNNISFGDGVCKIGMTRRLDPNDRVKELGDASVPDLFTVHAFIYTENAPSLEKHFHEHFKNHRVNLVNRRKEFFYISPDDALKALKNYQGDYAIESII